MLEVKGTFKGGALLRPFLWPPASGVAWPGNAPWSAEHCSAPNYHPAGPPGATDDLTSGGGFRRRTQWGGPPCPRPLQRFSSSASLAGRADCSATNSSWRALPPSAFYPARQTKAGKDRPRLGTGWAGRGIRRGVAARRLLQGRGALRAPSSLVAPPSWRHLQHGQESPRTLDVSFRRSLEAAPKLPPSSSNFTSQASAVKG